MPTDEQSPSQETLNDRATLNAVFAALATARKNRPEDRSPRARQYAVLITDLEKAYAYFYSWNYMNVEQHFWTDVPTE